jgi:hypothetical protein
MEDGALLRLGAQQIVWSGSHTRRVRTAYPKKL